MNGNYPYFEEGAYMSEGFSLNPNLSMPIPSNSQLQEHSFITIDS